MASETKGPREALVATIGTDGVQAAWERAGVRIAELEDAVLVERGLVTLERARADALAAENARLRGALTELWDLQPDYPATSLLGQAIEAARAALAGSGEQQQQVGCHKCRTWADVTDRKPHAAQAAISCSNCGTNVGQVWESVHSEPCYKLGCRQHGCKGH